MPGAPQNTTSDFPAIRGLDDADVAAWIRANDYAALTSHLTELDGTVFPAHIPMLTAAMS